MFVLFDTKLKIAVVLCVCLIAQDICVRAAVSCPAQYYCSGGDNSSMTPCPCSSYCPADSTAPLPCTLGDYCPPNSSSAVRCGAGYHCPTSCDQLPCPGGSYCGGGADVPVVCVAGTYCAGNSSAPVACSAGYYCLAGSSSQTLCPGGSHCPTTDAAPVVCSCGSYCPAGSTSAQPCGSGTYCPEGSVSSVTCSAGYYCSTPCSQVQCAAGYYCPAGSTNGMEFQCTAFGDYCPAGSGTAGSCPAGSYCPDTATATLCPCGYYCPAGTSDYSVNPCGFGTYCPEGSASSVTCSAGYYCSTPCSQVQCVAGQYCTAGSTSGTACTAFGDFCPAGSGTAGSCPAGSYCPDTATATECPCGYYCPERTSDYSVNPCSAGQWCPPGSSVAAACTARFFCPDTCTRTQCPCGYYCPLSTHNYSANSCNVSAGTYCPARSAAEGECTARFYCPTNCDRVVCPAGSYCPARSGAPIICPLGYYCPQQSVAPLPCRREAYCNATGLAAPSYTPSTSPTQTGTLTRTPSLSNTLAVSKSLRTLTMSSSAQQSRSESHTPSSATSRTVGSQTSTPSNSTWISSTRSLLPTETYTRSPTLLPTPTATPGVTLSGTASAPTTTASSTPTTSRTLSPSLTPTPSPSATITAPSQTENHSESTTVTVSASGPSPTRTNPSPTRTDSRSTSATTTMTSKTMCCNDTASASVSASFMQSMSARLNATVSLVVSLTHRTQSATATIELPIVLPQTALQKAAGVIEAGTLTASLISSSGGGALSAQVALSVGQCSGSTSDRDESGRMVIRESPPSPAVYLISPFFGQSSVVVALCTPLVGVAFAVVHFAFVAAVAQVRREALSVAMSMLRFPNWSLTFASLTVQGTLMGAFLCFSDSGSAGGGGAAAGYVLCGLVAVVFGCAIGLSDVYLRKKYVKGLRLQPCGVKPGWACIAKALPAVRWTPQFLERTLGVSFSPLRSKKVFLWFLFPKLVLPCLYALVAGVRTPTTTQTVACDALSIVIAIIVLGAAVVCAVTRPYRYPAQNVFVVVGYLLVTISTVLKFSVVQRGVDAATMSTINAVISILQGLQSGGFAVCVAISIVAVTDRPTPVVQEKRSFEAYASIAETEESRKDDYFEYDETLSGTPMVPLCVAVNHEGDAGIPFFDDFSEGDSDEDNEGGSHHSDAPQTAAVPPSWSIPETFGAPTVTRSDRSRSVLHRGRSSSMFGGVELPAAPVRCDIVSSECSGEDDRSAEAFLYRKQSLAAFGHRDPRYANVDIANDRATKDLKETDAASEDKFLTVMTTDMLKEFYSGGGDSSSTGSGPEQRHRRRAGSNRGDRVHSARSSSASGEDFVV